MLPPMKPLAKPQQRPGASVLPLRVPGLLAQRQEEEDTTPLLLRLEQEVVGMRSIPRLRLSEFAAIDGMCVNTVASDSLTKQVSGFCALCTVLSPSMCWRLLGFPAFPCSSRGRVVF